MATRGHTYPERRFPTTESFQHLLRTWKQDGTTKLLTYVWAAYDLLTEEVISGLDCSKEDEQLERDITGLLMLRIHKVMPGEAPFSAQHEAYELETRISAKAQPPQYDIAFLWYANPRIMWPLEAKVLRTDGGVAAYVTEIKDNYLTCRYAPFSGEAGMLGYLLSGQPRSAFKNIAKSGGWRLVPLGAFADRDHKTSSHTRKVPKGKPYPARFRCHHLIFRLQLRNSENDG